jgi:hypothetical protein
MRSYGIGPNFRGVKMIPAGLHLVTYGTGMERVGVFLQFGAGAGSMVEIAGWRCPCGHAPHERPSGLLRVQPLSPRGARVEVMVAVARVEVRAGVARAEVMEVVVRAPS